NLIGITPTPMDKYFGAHYPYRVMSYPPDETRINPQSEVLFEIVACWIAESGHFMVDRIDTSRPNGKFTMKERERWVMDYEITCANRKPQRVSFSVRRTGTTVQVSRHLKARRF